MSLLSGDLGAKYVEILRLMLSDVSRVALLQDPGLPYHAVVLKDAQAAARAMRMEIVPVQARNFEEIERALETIERERIRAVIVPASSLSAQYMRQITDLALRRRLAMLGAGRPQVVAGALVSYGTDIGDTYRRCAAYVDKILKGAKPGDLPIEQPTKFELVINRKTAAALGIAIPRELLLRADEVID
jgi:putative ABC transport system substrate-binding protein